MADKSLTQTDAAERLRISTSWLRVLTDRGEVPRNEDGSYPWPEVAEAYEAYQERVAEDAGPEGDDLDYRRARARKAMADAALKEDELRVRRGELVPADQVLPLVRKPLEAVNAALKSARRRHSKEWATRLGVTQAVAMSMIDELVEPIREDLWRVFEGDDGDGDRTED